MNIVKTIKTDRAATDIKTEAILRDAAFVLALTRRLAKEIRGGQEFRHVEASRAWSDRTSDISVAA